MPVQSAGAREDGLPETAGAGPYSTGGGGTVLDEGGYEILRRDTIRNEHEVTSVTSINDIARDLTIRMAARDFPGRPTRQVSDLYNTP